MAVDLSRAARALWRFPHEPGDEFLWEIGSENREDRWAYYYRFRVFEVEPTGLCAIEIKFNNNQDPPFQEISEFCIQAQPADLDRLSVLLDRFSKLEHEILEWTVQDGELR